MDEKIIEYFVTYFLDYAHAHVVVITIEAFAILAAMGVDLVAGLHKAKINGKRRTSRGLKMTAKKAHRYLSPFAVLTFLDIVAAIILPVPFFSMGFTAYILWCEYVSIREKAWEKAEIDKASRTINMVLENRDDIAKAIAELIAAKQSKEGDEEEKENPLIN